LVNLTIQVGASTPGTANIIEMPFAVATDPRVNVDVFGPSREINGQTKLVQRVEAGTVQQFAGENNTTCQYAFTRSGYNVWAVGNPANLVGDSQDFSIISSDRFNNVVTMMILRTSGHVAGGTNPATAAYREMRVNGLLTLSSSRRGWIGFPVSPVALPDNPNPGSRRLHVNAAGNLAVDTTEVSMKGHKHSASDVFGAVGLADTPTSASSPGEPGDVSYGPDHFYVCVAPNTWKRATITSW
jgi:hypothetical protein